LYATDWLHVKEAFCFLKRIALLLFSCYEKRKYYLPSNLALHSGLLFKRSLFAREARSELIVQ